MPSTIAKDYRHQFEEILIDEYQDTNQVQEAIISTIKRGDELDGNLFMVGDVKQSIYKFRQADPTLFMSKYHRFTKEGQQTDFELTYLITSAQERKYFQRLIIFLIV